MCCFHAGWRACAALIRGNSTTGDAEGADALAHLCQCLGVRDAGGELGHVVRGGRGDDVAGGDRVGAGFGRQARCTPNRQAGQCLQPVQLAVRPQPSAGIRCQGHGHLPAEGHGRLHEPGAQLLDSVGCRAHDSQYPAVVCPHSPTAPASIASPGPAVQQRRAMTGAVKAARGAGGCGAGKRSGRRMACSEATQAPTRMPWTHTPVGAAARSLSRRSRRRRLPAAGRSTPHTRAAVAPELGCADVRRLPGTWGRAPAFPRPEGASHRTSGNT